MIFLHFVFLYRVSNGNEYLFQAKEDVRDLFEFTQERFNVEITQQRLLVADSGKIQAKKKKVLRLETSGTLC